MQELVTNELVFGEEGVWSLAENREIDYSDGRSTEQHLEHVLTRSKNLSSTSEELESCIIDWPSAYHLSTSRSQLLRPFTYDSKKRVLEIGCGCGAITRFLGETFNNVTAIEGSSTRARLARLRTRDLTNVQILSAPFEQVHFTTQFDIIFCIGVFEYSNVFTHSPAPYEAILTYLSGITAPSGALVLAIENQFGLKYFAGTKEDHTGICFDGIEGYVSRAKSPRTFGIHQLRQLLSAHYQSTRFYFPYPDYKTPCCVVSGDLFDRVDAAELVGSVCTVDRNIDEKRLFDERLAVSEIAKNKMLPFFANSFLVIADKSDKTSVRFDQLGVLYSRGRNHSFRTLTTFLDTPDGVVAQKRPLNGANRVGLEQLVLRSCEDRWMDGPSIHMELLRRSRRSDCTLAELFAPAMAWAEKIRTLEIVHGSNRYVPGTYLDAIWRNSFNTSDGLRFIDLEWEWADSIPVNVVVIRAIWFFLQELFSTKIGGSVFGWCSTRTLIRRIAFVLGFRLTAEDFVAFREMEGNIAMTVFGMPRWRTHLSISAQLLCRPLANLCHALSRSSPPQRLLSLGRTLIASAARFRKRVRSMFDASV